MKKAYLIVTTLLAASSLTLWAADEKTIKGDGMCAKCELKETGSCQNAIKTQENGKEVVYYLEHNDVSKAFHSKICQGTEKVVAKGTVKEKDGKKILSVTSIDLDK